MNGTGKSAAGLWRKAGVVWMLLTLVLTATVAASYLPLGAVKLPLALGFAALKAGLVITVFMELPASKSATRLAALLGVLFVALLFGLSFADELTRPDQPRSFAPAPSLSAPP